MKKPKIGFVGLGLMGSAMVTRLLDCGYKLTVLGNKSRAPIEAAIARGAREAASAKALAEASDIIMICVTTSEVVESRMRGDNGILAGLTPGKTVIDFGTSLPSSTLALGAETEALGATYLDCPLGRPPHMALRGLLNIMGAGDKDGFNAVRPVLEVLGENVFHLGPLGTGHKVKLINNYFAMTSAVAMAEAYAMADAADVPRPVLSQVMSAGPSHSAIMDFISAFALEGDVELAFSIDNSAKDLGYYQSMAEDLKARSWISDGTVRALAGAQAAGQGAEMVPQILSYLTRNMRDQS